LKLVIAPDSFKGSMSAIEAAQAMEDGIKRVFADSEIIKIPLADGGEGTVDAMIAATGGRKVAVVVEDPLGRQINSFLGVLGDGKTAVVEMAAASGLPLLKPEEKNPYITSTYGTGQLIKAALDLGCREIIVGIGGSATNDGGAGMAEALGAVFLDAGGNRLPRGGRNLQKLSRIDTSQMDPRIKETRVTAACDVDNPLCGVCGASAVYGPQKGATNEMIQELDAALANFAGVIKNQLGLDVAEIPGAGAAGGLGAGLMAFLNGTLRPGIQLVLSAVGFEKHLQGASAVLTGEGRIDEQTAYGKAPIGVAQAAKKYQLPVLAFCGVLGGNYHKVYDKGIDYVGANVQAVIDLQTAIDKGYPLLVDNVERAMRALRLGMCLKR